MVIRLKSLTSFICPTKEKILKSYRRILECFGVMSGLALNYDKSIIIPLDWSEELVVNLKSCLGCSESKLPITYLGIPLGASPRRVSTWRPILEKIEKKLSSGLLSKVGRLVLIKIVLNSLPIYYLGPFKMPKVVARKIISL